MPTLRIEFVKALEAKEGISASAAPAFCLQEAELTIGASPTSAPNRPVAPDGATHVVFMAIGGAAYVDWDGQKGYDGFDPKPLDPASGDRFYIPAGGTRVFTGFKTGAHFGCVQSTIA
jgi:hypothetical protein